MGGHSLINSGTNFSGDVWFARIDSSGNVIWLKGAGGQEMDLSGGISLDKAGNLFVAASFSSPTVDFGNGVVISNSGSGLMYDIFVATYDPGGNFIRVKKAGGDVQDEVTGIDNCPVTGDCYMAGSSTSGIVFFDSLQLITSGSWDVYTVRIAPQITTTTDENPYSSLQVFPNPSDDYFVIGKLESGDRISISDISGRLIGDYTSQSGEEYFRYGHSLKPGMYFLRVDGKRGGRLVPLIVK